MFFSWKANLAISAQEEKSLEKMSMVQNQPLFIPGYNMSDRDE